MLLLYPENQAHNDLLSSKPARTPSVPLVLPVTAHVCVLEGEVTEGREAIEPQWLRSRESFNPATLLQGGQDAIQGARLDVPSLRLLDGLAQRNCVFRPRTRLARMSKAG